MELLKGKALKTFIGAIKKDGKGLVERIEHAAKSACVEAVNTRNTSAINMLADATKDIGSRALMRWIEKHGPVKWDKTADNSFSNEKGAFVLSEKKYDAAKADVAAYATKLAATPTYVAEQAKSDSNPFIDFDLRARLASLLKKADEIAKDETRKGKADDDLTGLEGLRGFIASLPVKIKAEAGSPAAKPKSSKGRSVAPTVEAPAAVQ